MNAIPLWLRGAFVRILLSRLGVIADQTPQPAEAQEAFTKTSRPTTACCLAYNTRAGAASSPEDCRSTVGSKGEPFRVHRGATETTTDYRRQTADDVVRSPVFSSLFRAAMAHPPIYSVLRLSSSHESNECELLY